MIRLILSITRYFKYQRLGGTLQILYLVFRLPGFEIQSFDKCLFIKSQCYQSVWNGKKAKIRKYSRHSSRLLFIIDLIITLIYSVRSSRESCIYSPIWNCKKHPLMWLLAGNNNGCDKLVIQVRYLTKHKKMKDKILSSVKTKINDRGMR